MLATFRGRDQTNFRQVSDMDNNTRFSADNRFSIIPHWVILSGISSGAIHLYAVLAKYADNDTGQAFPARSRLASDLGKSVDTIDRAAKELVRVGALKVTQRKRKGSKENYSNLYTLITANPNPTQVPDVIEVAATVRLGGRVDAAENNTHSPIPNLSTSSLRDDSRKEKDTFTTNAKASAHEAPKNPGGLTQGQRKTLRNQLVIIGKMLESGMKFYSDAVQEQWDTFVGMIEDSFHDDFDTYFADMLLNGKWTVSAKVATPYGAGIEINKLINTALSQ